MTKKRKIIITADDFGLSPGVNRSIVSLYRSGCISRTSLLPNCNYTDDAINVFKNDVPSMAIGIHFSLTCGRCCASPEDISLIASRDGCLKLNFLNIIFYLLNPFTRKKFLIQVENELNAQIMTIEKLGIKISHIDGHRHVHTIPGIFKVVQKIAAQHDISDIRLINESIFFIFRYVRPKSNIIPALIKFFVLRLFYFINGARTDRYFFSIMHSCKISPEVMLKFFLNKNKINSNRDSIEIMLHPGNPDIDKKYFNTLHKEEINQLLSFYRIDESLSAYELKRMGQLEV
ncbi:MAG TPA: ChbG/HpnK family deacetylase [Spirochaetota bacterium]|jgi:predicted glycoside hydrolase/deacetylase ChbG (UPF0249 family)|nr:ChbG/HpnK family deacetylase [Spirochaetota bacterium]HOV08862.1 ChbG/HpnK family deacetylase [Spirochaetota bacterium]